MKQSSPPPPSAGHVCVRGVSGPFPLRLRHFVLLRPSTSVIAPADCFPCYAHASHVGDRGEADQVSMFCFVSESPDACLYTESGPRLYGIHLLELFTTCWAERECLKCYLWFIWANGYRVARYLEDRQQGYDQER